MVLVTIAIASVVLYTMFQAKPAMQPIRIKDREQPRKRP